MSETQTPNTHGKAASSGYIFPKIIWEAQSFTYGGFISHTTHNTYITHITHTSHTCHTYHTHMPHIPDRSSDRSSDQLLRSSDLLPASQPTSQPARQPASQLAANQPAIWQIPECRQILRIPQILRISSDPEISRIPGIPGFPGNPRIREDTPIHTAWNQECVLYRPLFMANHFANDRPIEGPKTGVFTK